MILCQVHSVSEVLLTLPSVSSAGFAKPGREGSWRPYVYLTLVASQRFSLPFSQSALLGLLGSRRPVSMPRAMVGAPSALVMAGLKTRIDSGFSLTCDNQLQYARAW
jgi:hypothetical protein